MENDLNIKQSLFISLTKEDIMNYLTFKKKYKYLFFKTAIMIFAVFLPNLSNGSELKENSKYSIQYDFGTHPVGASQTTKEFYLCANDSEESQEAEGTVIKVVEKKETDIKKSKQKKRQRKMKRWNIPNSRNRVNMNRWQRDAKKNRTAVHIKSPYVTGKNPQAFKLHDEQCHQNSLLPGAKCKFEISFKPKKMGKQAATIIIPYTKDSIEGFITVIVVGAGGKHNQVQAGLSLPVLHKSGRNHF